MSLSLAIINCFSSCQALKSTIAIIERYTWSSKCYQSCAELLAALTCSSRTARPLIELVILFSCCSKTPQFTAPDLWLPNSPNVNPADCCIWAVNQERVYKTSVRATANLKQCLIETWMNIPQTVVDEAIDEWRLRLWACVKEEVISNIRCNH